MTAKMVQRGLRTGRQVPIQHSSKLRDRHANADHKGAESRVNRAYFVEAHFVDQLLEDQWIIGEKINAPLPIVEANRAGDDLLYLSSVPAADHSVFVHLALAFFDRQRVPVL